MEKNKVEKYHEVEGYELPPKIDEVDDKMYNYKIYADEKKLEIRISVKGTEYNFVFQGSKEQLIENSLLNEEKDIIKLANDIKQNIRYCQHKIEKHENNDFLNLTINGKIFSCVEMI